MTAMATPQRILILGCSGSGKSTLARALADRTGLPAVHLDFHFWGPGWTEQRDEFAGRVASLTAMDRWIIDGNYSHSGFLHARLERAEMVVLLDLPRWLCLVRVFLRLVRWRGILRPDMAPGCPEKVDWPFLRYIWNWRRFSRPRILEALHGFEGGITILATPSAVHRFLDILAPRTKPSSLHV